MQDDLLISKREMLAVLFQRRVGILLILLSCVGGAAFGVFYLISPTYQAEAVIIFNSNFLTEPLRDAPPESDFEKLATFHTQRDIFTSDRIAGEAARRTDLAKSRVISRIERIEMFVGDIKRWIGTELGIKKWTKPWSAEAAAIGAVKDGVKTFALPDSKAIRVTFRSKDPHETVVVLNAILEAQGDYFYGVIRDKAVGIEKYLAQEFARTRESLKESEDALYRFKQRDTMATMLLPKEPPATNGLRSAPLPSIVGVTDSTKMQEEMKIYILKLEEELRLAEQIVDNEKRQRLTTDLKARLRAYVNAVNVIPNRELELIRLKREYDTMQDSYQLLQRNLLKARIVSTGELDKMNLIDVFQRPFESEDIVFPQRRVIVTLAALLGVVLALTWAFMMDYLDHSIRGARDVQRYLGLRLLGSLRRIG